MVSSQGEADKLRRVSETVLRADVRTLDTLGVVDYRAELGGVSLPLVLRDYTG
jgi:hypothetical protein